jgi:uncharacterized cupin superfamily protein
MLGPPIESAGMETINGCTVIRSTETPEPIRFGPAETNASYVVEVGMFPPGTALPPHVHPNTDEVFYVGDGEATPSSATTSSSSARGLSSSCRGAPDAEHEFVPV